MNNNIKFINTSSECKNLMIKLSKSSLRVAGKEITKILKEDIPSKTGGLKKSVKAWVRFNKKTGTPFLDFGYLSRTQMKKRGVKFFVNPHWFEYGVKPHEITTKQLRKGEKKITYQLSRGSQKFGIKVQHPGLQAKNFLRNTVMNNISLIKKAQEEKLSELKDIMISEGARINLEGDEECD